MAAKKSQDEDLRRGLEELKQSGIAVDTGSADVVSRLAAEFGKGKERDLAAAYVLGRIPAPAAAEALVTLDRQTTDKDVKKEIKRAYFKLGQKGIGIPIAKKPESREIPLFSQAPAIEAYMSAVDGAGGRLIWIAKAQPNHGLQVIQGMLHDREGLMRIGGAQMPRKELRRMTREIKEQHGTTMIAIPWEYADQALWEGYEKAKARGQSGLENFHEVRSIIANGKPKERDHPIYRKLDCAEVRQGAWREASRRLLEEPELRYWILTDDWLRELMPQIQEAQASRLVLNPAQKEERLAAIVRGAVKQLCGGDNGSAFRRRLEDMALYFFETARVAQAQLAFAVALQVAEGDPGPLDVAFLTGLVQKSFAFLFSQEKAKKQEELSLILKP